MDLIPVIDTAKINPTRDSETMADCVQCLLDEGWTWQQAGAWAREAWGFSALLLRTGLTVRRN